LFQFAKCRFPTPTSDRDSSDEFEVTAENTKELHSKSLDNATEVPGSKQEPALQTGRIVGVACAIIIIVLIVLVAVIKGRMRPRHGPNDPTSGSASSTSEGVRPRSFTNSAYDDLPLKLPVTVANDESGV
jgi:flagellar biosynthesis/type III secretory pathway M-ring protein FliF/YscJ